MIFIMFSMNPNLKINILNDYLYIDVNDMKKKSYLKLMFAVCNYKKAKKFIESIDSFVISYENRNRFNFLNN